MKKYMNIDIIIEDETEVLISRSCFSDHTDSVVSDVMDLLEATTKKVKMGEKYLNNKMCEGEVRQIVMFHR